MKTKEVTNSKEMFFKKPINIVWIAIICTFLWGSAYPGIKGGYELFQIDAADVPSKLLFAGYRFTLAGILVLLYLFFTKKKFIFPSMQTIPKIFLLGVVQTTLQYIFFYIGLANTTGIKGSILNSSGAFFAVVAAHFIYKNDKLNLSKTIGCIVGFIGVILVNLGTGSIDGGFSLIGEGFVLLAALVLTIGSIITKWLTKNSDSVMITGYQLLIGGLVLILIGVLSKGSLTVITMKGLLLLLYLAFLSSVAFTLWAELLKHNPVGKISIYNFLVPIFGSALSAIFLGERFVDVKNVVALVFVCAGIYIVNRRSVSN